MNKKKVLGLALAIIALSACTATQSGKKKKKSSSEDSSSVTPIDPKVTGVSLNRENLGFNLNPDHTYRVETLIATVSGEGDYDKSVVWHSSNESVATVVNGVVTAFDLGTCDITCASSVNEDANAICHVSVVNDVPVIESVSISPANPSIDFKDTTTVQLTALVQGQYNPSQAVSWSTTSSIASVDASGLVTATATGNAVIKATSQKDTSKYGQITVSITDTTPKVNSVKVTIDGTVKTSYTLDLYEPNNKKTVQLGAQVDVSYGASQEVTWSSSDDTKVEVSSAGLVTAKATTVSAVTVTATSKFDSSKKGTISISVADNTPRVSSVTVTLPSTSLKQGKHMTAKETVLGTNVTDKSVKWTSSNTTVATINETTGEINGLQVGGPVTITATSNFDKTKSGSATFSVVEAGSSDAYTIMIYMCGSDLESGGGYATTDLKEMLAVTESQPDDVNIIIETGGAKSWKSTYGISANYLERYEIRDRALVRKAQLSKASMSTSSTFQSFLEWGINEYPADKMALIFWDHGSGLDGCCMDENFQSTSSWTYDYLDPIEAQTGFKNAFKNTNFTDKFEWIGYDCCLMQNVEIAALNSEFAHYQVASQVAEDGGGWDYTPWLTKLYSDVEGDTGALLTEICDAFVEYYSGSKTDQTLSWVKLDYVSTLVSAFDAYVGSSGKTYSNFQTAINAVRCYESQTDSYDFGQFLNYSSLSVTQTVKSAFTNFVGYTKYDSRYYTSKVPTGCSVFFGSGTDEDTYESITKTNFPNWSKLMLDNWSGGGWWY